MASILETIKTNKSIRPIKTLCMHLIINEYDETDNLIEIVNNFTNYINYYVKFSNKSSTVNNQIENVFKAKSIKGEIYNLEKNYKYFGKFCENKADYILVIDPNDQITGELIIPELLDDCYNVQYGEKIIYYKKFILKNDVSLNWHYDETIFKNISCNKVIKEDNIKGDYCIRSKKWINQMDSRVYIKDLNIVDEILNNPINILKNPISYYYISNILSFFDDLNELNDTFYDYFKTIKINEFSGILMDILLLVKSVILNKLGKYEESFDMSNNVLNRNIISESLWNIAQNIRNYNIEHIKDKYLERPDKKIM